MKSFIRLFILTALIAFNQLAVAHESHSSVFHSLFGENLTHWLIGHQGYIGLSFALLIGFLFVKLSFKKSVRALLLGKNNSK